MAYERYSQLLSAALLTLMGLVAGSYGTMVGAGGGFLLVPLLLLTRPDLPAATVTTLSLGAVFFNALSGSIAYARQRRIDYRTGLLFASATIPAAAAGALVVDHLPHELFQLTFGALLVIVGLFIFVRRPVEARGGVSSAGFRRHVTDVRGRHYEWSYNLPAGMAMSLIVGFLAAVLGIGGGILQVPVMVSLLTFPAAIATATSTFVLLFTSLSATVTHAAHQDFNGVVQSTALVAFGMVVGAQVGARVSQRLSNQLIVRLLAIALTFVGIRLIQTALQH